MKKIRVTSTGKLLLFSSVGDAFSHWYFVASCYQVFPNVLQLVTKAPADCMCRPCTAVEDEVMASEIAGFADPGAMMKSFIKL